MIYRSVADDIADLVKENKSLKKKIKEKENLLKEIVAIHKKEQEEFKKLTEIAETFVNLAASLNIINLDQWQRA